MPYLDFEASTELSLRGKFSMVFHTGRSYLQPQNNNRSDIIQITLDSMAAMKYAEGIFWITMQHGLPV